MSNIVDEIAELKAKQETLYVEAHQRRSDILSELATLCGWLGPLTRDEIPAGVLRRRHRKAQKAAPRVRKVKGEEGRAA